MLKSAPDHRARQMTKVPRHQVIYCAYRGDGDMLGINRGVRWKEANAQEMASKLPRFRSESEERNPVQKGNAALGDDGVPDSHLLEDHHGRDEFELSCREAPPLGSDALMSGGDKVATRLSSQVAENGGLNVSALRHLKKLPSGSEIATRRHPTPP